MPFAYESLGKVVAIREAPSVRALGLGSVQPFGGVEYQEIVFDKDYPNDMHYRWLKLENGYCNYAYPPAGLRFELHRKFGVLLHDHELYGLSRPERTHAPLSTRGLPETVKLLDNRRVVLTQERQLFWFGILKKSAPTLPESELKRAWRSLTRSNAAFTNKAGSDLCADYINQANLDKEPMRFEPILCGGAYVLIIGEPFRTWQGWFYKIAVLHPKMDLSILTPEATPYLFFRALSSTRDTRPGCLRVIEPFWMLDGADVRVPIFSMGTTNAVPFNRVRLLAENDPIPSPYCM